MTSFIEVYGSNSAPIGKNINKTAVRVEVLIANDGHSLMFHVISIAMGQNPGTPVNTQKPLQKKRTVYVEWNRPHKGTSYRLKAFKNPLINPKKSQKRTDKVLPALCL